MPQAHPYQNYQTAEVQTADQRRLIIMLYDGAIRFLKKADAKIEAKDFEGAHNYLVRSREIVAELLASLRPEIAGQVGTNLKRLYVYVFNRIVEANLLKDQAILAEVIGILTTLREGWENIKLAPQARGPGEELRKVNLRG
ncbi:MAG: flagellar export chaperone FliS [SAR324 cluster bacterium]|nr:flagellar export chaperone FliS [SAR324 cluster bacterium]